MHKWFGSRAATRCAVGMGVLPVVLAAAIFPAAADPRSPSTPPLQAQEDQSYGQAKKHGLRTVAPDDFHIGTAVAGGGHHLDAD